MKHTHTHAHGPLNDFMESEAMDESSSNLQEHRKEFDTRSEYKEYDVH